MKKTVGCLWLALILTLLFPLSVVGQAQPAPLTLTLYTLGVEPETATLSITLQINNSQDTNHSCMLYSVIQNEDGTADSIQTTSFSAKPGKNFASFSHAYHQAGEGKTLWIYCWNNAMQPLASPVEHRLDFSPTVTGLTLSPQSPVIYLSQTKATALTVTHTPQSQPAPTLEFSSLDPEIVTVAADGTLTPLAAGTATVTVVNTHRTAFATCKVLVVTAPTKLQLNASTLSIEVKEEFLFTPTITPEDAPNKQVSYSSSNPAIATVSSKGVVTGVAVGTATVTAQMADGSAKATCQVTVTPQVTGITLNQHSIAMWDYGMYYLTATVKGGSGQKVIWKSSNDDVATVSDSGIVFGVAKGSATITATAGKITASCKVQVYREYDYTGTIAAHFESRDNPASISGSGTGKSYGCFQLYAGSNGPKTFYNWLISNNLQKEIGTVLKAAHQKDGGKDKIFGTNFDTAWKTIAKEQKEEFRSCQMAYCMSLYYEPLVNRLVSELNFYPDNYSLAMKSALWSRAIQHGVGGAFNRIRDAFATLGGFEGQSEKDLITAIYKECGKVVTSPPSNTSVPMNKESSIAVEYGLVGKYMKYYSSSSSSMQAGVWKRLNVTELQMLYHLLENPPVYITPQK